jgi:hypothetical protein
MFSLGIIGYSGNILAYTNWVGVTNGVWSNTANWSPTVVPNSTTANANIGNTSGASGNVDIDVNTTLNQLKFSSSGTTWTVKTSTAKTLTFGGTTPTILSTTGFTGVVTAPIILSSDLLIDSTVNTAITIGGTITGASKSITQIGTTTVAINVSNTATLTGTGSYNFSSTALNLNNLTALGSLGIVWTNTKPTSTVKVVSGTFSSPIAFNDTGSGKYLLINDTVTNDFSGTWTGSLQHELEINGSSTAWTGILDVSGNLSGLVASGGFLHFSGFSNSGTFVGAATTVMRITGTAATTLSTSMPISIGNTLFGYANATFGNQFTFNKTGTISNPISIISSVSGANASIISLTAASGGDFTGAMVLNSNSSAKVNTFKTLGTITISGNISNGASNAASLTFSPTGTLTLSGTNSFTSPILLDSGILNVTGSTLNTVITVNGNGGTLKGTGSIGTVVTTGATPHLEARGLVSPSTSDILTINGSLTEGAGTTHTFQSDATGASSKLQVNGSPTMNGTVTVSTATVGKTYTIMTYTGTSSGSWTSTQGGTVVNNTGTKTVTVAF